MRNHNSVQISNMVRLSALGALTAGAMLVTGCGALMAPTESVAKIAGVAMQGRVYGGQQPVSGTTIQLYAANLTGYGAGSFALLTSTVTTDSNGNFSITGAYTCPSSTTPVYITANGGTAGGFSANSSIAMMSALGACGNLSASTYISINELTTVASAYALAPFMSSASQLSTSSTNVTGLTNAFAGVNKLVNIATGATPGSALPTGATEPVAELNSLANILAACVNSASGSTACNGLFTNSTPAGGTAPTDTLQAILNIAKNPGRNVAALFNLVPPSPPFQPSLSSAPTDYTVAVKYAPASTFSTPSGAAVDTSGNLWVTNGGNNTISILNASTGVATPATGGSLNVPSGIAFDQSGNAWVPNKGNSTLSVFTSAGSGSVSSGLPGGFLSAPSSIAIDGQNRLWITNSGNNAVTSLTTSGTTIQSGSNYTSVGGVTAPVAVAINPR